MPVGGIREKVLGAHRAGITKVILPAQNEKDAHDLPPSVRSMTLSYARTIEGVLEEVFGSDIWVNSERPRNPREARL